jgi:hypothetical protein
MSEQVGASHVVVDEEKKGEGRWEMGCRTGTGMDGSGWAGGKRKERGEGGPPEREGVEGEMGCQGRKGKKARREGPGVSWLGFL